MVMRAFVVQIDFAADGDRFIIDLGELAVVVFKQALVCARKVERAVLAKVDPKCIFIRSTGE